MRLYHHCIGIPDLEYEEPKKGRKVTHLKDLLDTYYGKNKRGTEERDYFRSLECNVCKKVLEKTDEEYTQI